jgi:hypothetical protein
VLAQTIYLKIFVWDNNWSVYGGILMGCAGGILYWLYLKVDFANIQRDV